MKILLTNDDGIAAPGILALADQLKKEHEVTVVAPDRERSGAGHSITFMDTFWVRTCAIDGVSAFAISGTPADCVRLVLSGGFELTDRPDLVISGINFGHNCGFHVFYSGTVAAAIQAATVGVDAVAVSMDADDDIANLGRIAEMTQGIVFNRLLPDVHGKRFILNINFPKLECIVDENFLWTRQSEIMAPEVFKIEKDEGERRLYRPGMGAFVEPEPGSDRWAVQSGRISVTKLTCNLSCS